MAVLLTQCVNLVLQGLCLHLVELRHDCIRVVLVCITKHEGIGVRSIIDGVSLLAYRQLDVTIHRSDGIVRLTATFCQLSSDGIVALHQSGDNLVGVHAHLVAETTNLLTKTVDCSHYRIARCVEGSSQTLDIIAVALDCLHDDSGVRIVVQHWHYSTLSVGAHATIATEAKAVVAHEDEEKENGEDVITPAVTVSLVVQQRYESRVNTLSLHKGREHGKDTTCSRIARTSFWIEYISFAFHILTN